jgi:hypothetical protein
MYLVNPVPTRAQTTGHLTPTLSLSVLWICEAEGGRPGAGNILDDEQLINTLNNSKLTSGMISNRVKEAEETERSINETREHYRPTATRGSILYFVMADLALINPMYQFSLAYFTKLFSHCIDSSEKSDDLATRLQTLSAFITEFIFNNVQVTTSAAMLAWPCFPLGRTSHTHTRTGMSVGVRLCMAPTVAKLRCMACGCRGGCSRSTSCCSASSCAPPSCGTRRPGR